VTRVQSTNNIAFKEWAAVCAALAAGRQTLILRKGGIDEGSEGFRITHREFWLLPTQFHQDLSQLTAGGEQFWRQAQECQPAVGQFRIELYAVAERVFEITSLDTLRTLTDYHILADAVIEQRFKYRRPGLFVLGVRIHRIPAPHLVEDDPYIAGCKSWVELPKGLSTEDAQPVLDDQQFADQIQKIERLLEVSP
jgi:hypothetical protein